MKVLNFILLFLTHVIIANAQQEIRKEYDPQNQYYNYSNKLNVDNGVIEVKGKNNELIRKIYLTSNKSEHYNILTAIADSFFLQQNYNSAAVLYKQAIALNNNLGKVKHRYNLACSLASSENVDDAFIQLQIMVTKGKFSDKKQIENEKLLFPLKKDKRWSEILSLIEDNLKNVQDALNFEINQKHQ